MRAPRLALVPVFLALAAAAQAQDIPFTEAETRALLAHGPWPVPATRDPSNPVSGNKEAIVFGEVLFFEKRLSPGRKVACNTCHVPERNWTDNRNRGAALAEVERNTPTLMNLRLARLFGWSGASDRLSVQSVRPILDPRELGATPHHVAELVRSDADLACRYRKAFGAPPSRTDDKAVLADVGQALAALVETFETPPTPFDRFRDALARGERIKPWVYAEAAQRGAKIFVGKGTCSTCHSGPNFTDGKLHDNGFAVLAANGRADPGKDGAFKVPTLRHLMLTSPYGHHGEVETLAQAVRHYSERGSREVKALDLSPAEQSDLIVFLESLSTLGNPWRPEDRGRCS